MYRWFDLNYTHGNKLGNTLRPWGKFEKIHFPFSGDTEIFITYISYLGLAPDQFMDIHNILSLCYGGYNVPYVKNPHLLNTSLPFCFCTPQNSIFECKTGTKC